MKKTVKVKYRKNVIWEDKHKYYGRPGFYLSVKKTHYHDRLQAEGYTQSGYYTGSEITVIISVFRNWISSEPETVMLNTTYKGFDYQRNYNIISTERGIQLRCAIFIKDILNKKIK